MVELFKNRKLVIATMHHKEKVISPIVESGLGALCFVPKDFDTDKFGTFTREIKRDGDMLKAARAKLNTAMEMSGCDLGVASEGSFGVHPSMPFIQSNLELTLLIDKKNNLEIKGHYRNPDINIDEKYVDTIDEAVEFANKCGFPDQGIIVRRTKNGKRFLYKNVQTTNDLKHRVERILNLPFTSKVFLETDMRAHRNPTRMKGITLSTQDLITNIKSECPQCRMPGFVITDIIKGLLCNSCGLETDLPLFNISHCDKCNYKKEERITKYGEFADEGQCKTCNP